MGIYVVAWNPLMFPQWFFNLELAGGSDILIYYITSLKLLLFEISKVSYFSWIHQCSRYNVACHDGIPFMGGYYTKYVDDIVHLKFPMEFPLFYHL